MKLTIDEYSKHFKMSKEMIHSKLKMKQLNFIIENGITYITTMNNFVDKDNTPENHQEKNVLLTLKQSPVQPKTTVAAVLALYQRENKQLKEKIYQLETKIDKLINDKEDMLRAEIDKIEHVYRSKDEQLKSILELINTKLMLEQQNQTIHEVETYRAQERKHPDIRIQAELIELRDYLRTLDLESYQRKIIKKRFIAVHDSDIRIIQQNGKLYLDFSKYDYSDLLEY